MKKTILVLVVMLTCLSVFAQNGVIRELSGTVEIKTAGASSYVVATTGAQVSQDTVISTGFKSTALVEVGSAVIAVRPLTRLTLTEIQASTGAETLNVNLAAGRLRVDVNPPAGTRASMSVTTPMATASVRGTGFNIDTHSVSVDSGNVSYSGSKGGPPVSVGTGSESQVGANGNTIKPIELKVAGLIVAPPKGLSESGAGGGSVTTGISDGGGGSTSGDGINIIIRY